MTSNDFIYWLNGFMEIANPDTLSAAQIQVIREHIALVLTKVTPTPSIDFSPVYIPTPHDIGWKKSPKSDLPTYGPPLVTCTTGPAAGAIGGTECAKPSTGKEFLTRQLGAFSSDGKIC